MTYAGASPPGEAIVPYYLEILQALHPLFSLTGKGTEGGVVDNAAAAVARMIMTSPQHVPMDQVLPVFLSALPLKADRSENEAVYTCLLGLIHMRHPEALRLLDGVLSEWTGGKRHKFTLVFSGARIPLPSLSNLLVWSM